MQRPTVVFLALILVAGTAGAQQKAQSQEKYQRKSGLWQFTRTSTLVGKEPVNYELCIDQASDNALRQLLGAMRSERCDTSKVARNGDALTVDAACTIEKGHAKATTHSVITGKFDSAYKVESKATVEPARHGKTDHTSLLEAKWVGACPAGQRPGDLLLPTGHRVNIADAEAQGQRKTPGRVKGTSNYTGPSRNRMPSQTQTLPELHTMPPQPAPVPPAPTN